MNITWKLKISNYKFSKKKLGIQNAKLEFGKQKLRTFEKRRF